MERAGQTIQRHCGYFRALLRIICTARLVTIAKADFQAHLTPGKRDENGFHEQELRGARHKILQRRNRQTHQRFQYHAIRDSTAGYGTAAGQRRIENTNPGARRRDYPPQTDAGRTAQGQARSRRCQPCEKRLSRQYEPRAAYPPQRHHRIQRNAGGGDARFREAGKSAGPAEDSIGWQALIVLDQRRARSLQDRGREDGLAPRDIRRVVDGRRDGYYAAAGDCEKCQQRSGSLG